MTTSLYGLNVEYTNRSGHFMVLSAPGGLREEALSAFHVRMLTGNRLDGLLELQLERCNGETLLHYAITGKRMLTHSMRLEKLTQQTYYRLLLRAAEILRDSAVNMLEPGRYILHDEFMYTGSGLTDLYLTYVPVRELPGKQDPAADLLALASRWIQGVPELAGSGFQELMRCLQDEAFSLQGLCLLLQRLSTQTDHPAGVESYTIGRQGGASAGSPGFSPRLPEGGGAAGSWQHAHLHRTAGSGGADPKPAPMPELAASAGEPAYRGGAAGTDASPYARNGQPVPDWLGTPASPGSMSGAAAGELPDGEERQTAASRRPLYAILGTVLAVAMIWKVYADSPGETRLYICSGLSAITAYAGLTLFRKWRRNREGVEEGTAVNSTFPPDSPAEQPGMSSRGLSTQDAEAAAFFSRIGLGTASTSSESLPSETWTGSAGLHHSDRRTGTTPPSYHSSADSNPENRVPGAGEGNSLRLPEMAAFRGPAAAASLDHPAAYMESGQAASPFSPGELHEAQMQAELSMRTTLLQPPDATVFLGNTGREPQVPASPPYLEWTSDGQTKRMILQRERFVIGRAEGEADGLLTMAGVSRLHAELQRDGAAGVIGIKDLGSRNGTSVNGEALVPYQLQPLQAGDRISIAAAELVLVIPSSSPSR